MQLGGGRACYVSREITGETKEFRGSSKSQDGLQRRIEFLDDGPNGLNRKTRLRHAGQMRARVQVER